MTAFMDRTPWPAQGLCRLWQKLGAGLLVVAMMALGVAGVVALPSPAGAVVQIDISRGNVAPLPIAVAPFNGEGGRAQEIGSNIAFVIANNLERSGLFKPLDRKAFIDSPSGDGTRPRFADWRAINAEALVQGNVIPKGDGRLRVEFRLWDVYGEQQMAGLAYFTVPENWRRVAHIISDAIFTRITGESGYFDTRIVYVAESGPAKKRQKRLAIMDQDGENHRFLTDGETLVLTPRFSPTLQEITYLAYFNNKPRVYIFNIDTGQQEVLGDFPGMTFAPRFSPDGNKVIMSMASHGNTDVYVMDLRTRRKRRLTRHPSIDTSPSFSPDNRWVTFNSDRGGSQQIYVMTADGDNIRRISFGQGRYATPVWSPRGDLIAFTRMANGKFYIGVMRPDGSHERMLASGFIVESPTWAPNGRFLSFFRQERTRSDGRGGQTRLYTIDLTGRNEREIITPVSASDPAWSPLIP